MRGSRCPGRWSPTGGSPPPCAEAPRTGWSCRRGCGRRWPPCECDPVLAWAWCDDLLGDVVRVGGGGSSQWYCGASPLRPLPGAGAPGGLAEPACPRADFPMMIGPRLAALTLLLTACGGVVAVATPTPRCRPAPSLAPPSAAAAPVSATADHAQVDPGRTVIFTEIAAGPSTVQVDCTQPLQVVVTDGTGLSVYSGYSAAAPARACGAA